MKTFREVAREYLDEKIPDLTDEKFNALMRTLSETSGRAKSVMMDHPFFEDVDLCYNSSIDGKTDEEKIEQFIRLYLEAPRPLEPSAIKTEEQARAYLLNMVKAIREGGMPPVNVIQLLHKGKVSLVMAGGRTRAAAAKIANAKIPTNLLTIRI